MRSLVLAAQLGIDVFFYDPRSCGSVDRTKTTTELLRQFSTRDVDNIANRITTRPCRVLDWATSAELFCPSTRPYVA